MVRKLDNFSAANEKRGAQHPAAILLQFRKVIAQKRSELKERRPLSEAPGEIALLSTNKLYATRPAIPN